MLIGKGLARHQDRGDEPAAVVQRVPFRRQVQRHPQALHLPLRHGDEGLGQHGHGVVLLRHQRHDLRGLALPLHLHVLAQGQAVLAQQIGQGVLRRGALAGGVDSLAVEGGDVRHGLAALFHDVQHTQSAHRQQLYAALGLVVQDGGHVGGHRQNVQLALHQLRRQLIGGGRHGEGVLVGGIAGPGVRQQLHHAHGGGALQPAQPDGDLLRRGVVHRGRVDLLLAAGGQGQRQHQCQQQGNDLFHVSCSSREKNIAAMGIIRPFSRTVS